MKNHGFNVAERLIGIKTDSGPVSRQFELLDPGMGFRRYPKKIIPVGRALA